VVEEGAHRWFEDLPGPCSESSRARRMDTGAWRSARRSRSSTSGRGSPTASPTSTTRVVRTRRW
jgi:hypothetical protein